MNDEELGNDKLNLNNSTPSASDDISESSHFLRRTSAEVIRKRVKAIDQVNDHEAAVKACANCPDFCFQTIYGIHFHPLNFVLLSIWLVAILLFVVMVGGALQSKWDRVNAETSTSVSLHHTHHLDFPAITICNMASEVPLKAQKCSSFDSTKECPDYKIPINLKYQGSNTLDTSKAAGAVVSEIKSDKDDRNEPSQFNLTNVEDREKARSSHLNTLRHCLVFNNDKLQQYSTRRKGLADALTVVLKINIDMYPKHAKYSGVHIDLHSQCDREIGECPEELDSTLVAAPGSPHFYRMTKHHHHYLNGTIIEYYEAKDSASGDYEFTKHFGAKNDTVVLTFLYADMSLMEALEMPKYTWFSLMAEIGGLMGLLFGVGIVNILSMVSIWSCVLVVVEKYKCVLNTPLFVYFIFVYKTLS